MARFFPNILETPSAARIAELGRLARDVRPDRLPPYKELPPASQGVRLQMTHLQVMDGMQGVLGLPGAGGVYVVSSVIDGLGEQPITFQGKVYRDVENGQMLPLGHEGDPTGVFTVYLCEGKLPRLLSFSLLVLRSREGLRQLGQVLTKVEKDDRFTKLSEQVGSALAVANPAYGLVWQAADVAINLVGEYLSAKPDDQLGYYQANYTNLFDDLGVGKHPADAPTMGVGMIRLAYEVDVA